MLDPRLREKLDTGSRQVHCEIILHPVLGRQLIEVPHTTKHTVGPEDRNNTGIPVDAERLVSLAADIAEEVPLPAFLQCLGEHAPFHVVVRAKGVDDEGLHNAADELLQDADHEVFELLLDARISEKFREQHENDVVARCWEDVVELAWHVIRESP